MADEHQPGVPAVEIKDVTVTFGAQTVLDRVSITVQPKDFLGIIGPNGGGKTTLLKVLVGLIRPDSGSVRVFGKPAAQARLEVGYVPQGSGGGRDFPASVSDVVLMGRVRKRGLFRRFSAEDRQAAEGALEQVGMSDLGDRQIGQLSAGQQQRVLIARALATRPRLLILDEPAAALDPNVGHSLYALLDKLGQDITIIMVTHDMGVLYRTVSKVACLSQRLFTHEDAERLDPKALEKAYGCPIDLIAHGDFPHRVFEPHCGDSGEE